MLAASLPSCGGTRSPAEGTAPEGSTEVEAAPEVSAEQFAAARVEGGVPAASPDPSGGAWRVIEVPNGGSEVSIVATPSEWLALSTRNLGDARALNDIQSMLYRTSDGVHWRAIPLDPGHHDLMLQSLAYGDGRYVMLGQRFGENGGGVIWTSSDAERWQEATQQPDYVYIWRRLAHAGGRFFGFGFTWLGVSETGEVWQGVQTSNVQPTAVAYGGGRYLLRSAPPPAAATRTAPPGKRLASARARCGCVVRAAPASRAAAPELAAGARPPISVWDPGDRHAGSGPRMTEPITTRVRPIRLAILDDYQDVARRFADWSSLPPGSELRVYHAHCREESELAARLAPFEAIVAMRERTAFTRSLLAQLPELRLLVTTGMRNFAIDLAAAAEQGVTVCGTDGLPYPTAELTWGLILGLARHLPEEDRALRAGAWQKTIGTGLLGKTLGVLGLGRLGAQVARIGQAFGMHVIAWSPNLTAPRASAAGASWVERDELFRRSDVLSLHLVLSERTRGLIGQRELGLMKPSALLVNTSRGPLVDEAALVAALRARAIAGAGLDVFDTEPLPPEHPLLGLPNTLLTPHLGYVTEETYRIFYTQALEDVQAYLAGQPLRVLST